MRKFLIMLSLLVAYSISVYAQSPPLTYTAYPALAANWTGSCTSAAITQNSLVNGLDAEDGWMKFNLSGIPTGAYIASVELHGYVNSTYWPYWSITPVTLDPTDPSTTASALYADINAEAAAGYYNYMEESSSFSTGWKTVSLGGPVLANIQNSLANGWFAIGIASTDNSTSYWINFDGWNETNVPYLVITYYSGTVVLGCTDPSATNYNPNAVIDNGSCTYLVPGNDSCQNAYSVPATGSSYPYTVTGTNLGATIDCPTVLGWQAVWYAVELPYANNNLSVMFSNMSEAITNAGIVIFEDCSDCNAYIAADNYVWGASDLSIYWNNLPGPGVVYFPAYLAPAMSFSATFDVEESVCSIDASFLAYEVSGMDWGFYTFDIYSSSGYYVEWGFGDGNYVTGSDWVFHTYNAAGDYLVYCYVEDLNDPSCWDYTEQWVTIGQVCNIDASFYAYDYGLGSWEFGTNYSFPSTDYYVFWDFGDGNSTSGSDIVNHTYTASGTYNVIVYVEDLLTGCWSQSETAYYVDVSPPCDANASFGYESDGQLTVWTWLYSVISPSSNVTWDWGDGFTSIGMAGEHTYAASGNYIITCTVSNPSIPNCWDQYGVSVTLEGANPGWQVTNTGINHTILLPMSANITIDDIPVVPGDYIGVFFDNFGVQTCGGFMQYTGQTIALAAWGDDPQTPVKDGFAMGEEFTWKLWSAATMMEYSAQAVYMPVGMGGITHQQFFAVNGLSGIESLVYNSFDVQTILLNQGWSIVSTYIVPFSPSLVDVFAPVASDLVIAKSGGGLVYWPAYGLNGIGNWQIAEGYQVKMNAVHTLDIIGDAVVPETTPLNVPNGWSIISYLRNSPHDIVAMMAPMASDIVIIKNGAGMVYWPYWGLNAIGNMMPGEGYQVDMYSAHTMYYPPNGPTSSMKTTFVNPQYYFDVFNTGNNMTVGIPASAWGVEPQVGDEIGIFSTNGALVGSGVYSGDMMAIAVWGDDFVTSESEGIVDGETYTFRLWNHITGEQQNLTVANWYEGSEVFSTNGIAVVGKFMIPETSSDAFALYQNSPNPFRNTTEISFYLPEDSYVKLEVYNALGEMIEVVVSEQMDRGEHVVVLDGTMFVAGNYMYRITTDGYTATKTMNVVK